MLPVVSSARVRRNPVSLGPWIVSLLSACGDPGADTHATTSQGSADATGASQASGSQGDVDTTDPGTTADGPNDTGPSDTGPGGTTAGDCDFELVTGFDVSVPTLGTPRPALNEFYVDESFGLSIARVTDPSQIDDHDPPSWVRHEYSRRPAFNADSTRAIMMSSNGWVRLYDVASDGALSFVKTLDLGETQEPNWDPVDPDVIYTFAEYAGALTISSYDVTNDAQSVVRDLGARVHAVFPDAVGMWTKQEGRPSNDGRVWCMEVGSNDGPGGQFVAAGFIAYDFAADELLGTLAVDESPDHISTSGSGAYCVPSWDLPIGTRAYTTDFAGFVQLHDRSEHSDVALTAEGDDVLVYTAYDGADAGSVMMVRMSDGMATPLFELYGPNSSSSAFHISGTSWKRPGYVVVSSYECTENGGACDPHTQWFADKVMIVELRADPTIHHLAHTHRGDAGYFSEPQAVANADLTRVLFASTWESDAESDLASYLIRVPDCR